MTSTSSIHIDFETRSKIDLVRQGVYRYAMDESTDVLCVAFGLGQSEVQVFDTLPLHIIDTLKQRIKEGCLFFAFNANFERQLWRHVFAKKYQLPDIPVSQWRCVAAQAMSCGLPASLDGVANALDLGIQKDAKGARLINKYSKPLANGMFMPLIGQDKLDFLSYCKRDVEIERELSARVPFLSAYEQKVWELDQEINDRGIRIDTKGVEAALRIIEEEKTRGEDLLRKATNGQVQSVTEVGKIKALLGMESLTKQTVKDAVKDATGDALKVLELRAELGQTALAKYAAMKACCGTDGRARGLLLYHAAHTGRWGGRLIQPQNLPQGKVKGCHEIDLRYDNMPLIELYAKPLDFVSSATRNMFLADEGEELVMVDYAAIEARVVAWLAECQTALDIFARQDAGDKTADIYKLMASAIYGKPVMEVTKSERQLGKIAVLACSYGMGSDKFQQSCAGYGVSIGKELAAKSVNAYRSTFKEIPSLWRKIEQDGVHERGNFYRDKDMHDFLLYRLPSRRNLCYYKWGTLNGRPSHLAKESGSKRLVRRETYGARLVENISQSVARDILADAMLRLREYGYKIVLTVHDEIVVSVKDAKRHVENICSIMKTPPAWAKGLPLNVEACIYHKYKK